MSKYILYFISNLAVILLSSLSLSASPIGALITDFQVGVATISIPIPIESDSLSLYDPVIHTIGAQSLLTPVDPRIAPALFTSSVETIGDIRTLRYSIETQNGGAFAEPSVFTDLQQSDAGLLSISLTPFSDFDDPDRTGNPLNFDFNALLIGTMGEILRSASFNSAQNLAGFGWPTTIDAPNPFDGEYTAGRGKPSSIEITYTYRVVPEPASVILLTFGVMILVTSEKRRRS